jgi:hypothetical protein
MIVKDHDEPSDRQEQTAILWSADPAQSPWLQGERSWVVDLLLAPAVRYELVSGPPGAALEPETGVFTWNPPREQQASEIKIRARDPAKPQIAETASVNITTIPKRL